jgi:hypothetical protein
MAVMAGEQGGEKPLVGPRARQAIEMGNPTVEGSRKLVTGMSKEQQEKMKGEAKKELTPEQQEILERLRKAKNSEERVRLFGVIADDVGLEAVISLFPELGDGTSSTVSGLYLLYEAKNADLGIGAYLKIIGLEAADFAVGAVPLVGDALDVFFKANKWAGKSFEQQTEDLIKKAREAGVPEEKISILTQKAEKWPRLATKAVGLYSKAKAGTSREAEPRQSQSTGQ